VKLGSIEKTSPVGKVPAKIVNTGNPLLVARMEKIYGHLEKAGIHQSTIAEVLDWDMHTMKMIKARKITLQSVETLRSEKNLEMDTSPKTPEDSNPQALGFSKTSSIQNAESARSSRLQSQTHNLHLTSRLFLPASREELEKDHLDISLVDSSMKPLAQLTLPLEGFQLHPDQVFKRTLRGTARRASSASRENMSSQPDGQDYKLIEAEVEIRLQTLVKTRFDTISENPLEEDLKTGISSSSVANTTSSPSVQVTASTRSLPMPPNGHPSVGTAVPKFDPFDLREPEDVDHHPAPPPPRRRWPGISCARRKPTKA